MGLRQGGSDWVPAIAVAAVIVVAGVAGDAGRELLAYDRQAIIDGEYWRLITAHFVHLDIAHMLLNLAALGLVWYLVGHELRLAEWLMVWVLAILTIDVALWVREPDLQWYVGLSGVLHGLLAAGLVATFGRWGPELWIVAVALVGKLAYEQLIGPIPGSEEVAGGNVIVAAHLFGAISGTISGLAVAIRVRRNPSI